MPLPRRRSSFLGQPSAAERSSTTASCVRSGSGNSTTIGGGPRGVFVGTTPIMMMSGMGVTSNMGTRVSRRALGISSVFLQGLRSTSVPVLSRHGAGERHGQQGGASAAGGLNGCLMEYRDKVRALEQLNQQLEEQIRHCLDRRSSSAGAWGPLRQDWEDIYRQVSESILDNARLMLQTENIHANAEDFKERYENEQPFRKAVEEEINSLYKVIDEANLTKTELDAQIDSMREQLRDLEQNHQEDVRVLYHQLAGREVDEPDAPIETSLDHILEHIRNQWERVIERNRAETDSYLECKQAECVSSCKLSREEEELEMLKVECNDACCRIQSLQAETESIRALKRGLENSLTDARHWHDMELQNMGSVVAKLEAELGDVRSDIEQQRRDYDTLLSNKLRMEQEIGLYHGILDGEESRFQPAPAPHPAPHKGSSVPEGPATAPVPDGETLPSAGSDAK